MHLTFDCNKLIVSSVFVDDHLDNRQPDKQMEISTSFKLVQLRNNKYISTVIATSTTHLKAIHRHNAFPLYFIEIVCTESFVCNALFGAGNSL